MRWSAAHFPDIARLPGVRTFNSPAFRSLVAIVLAASGLAVLGAILAAQARQPIESGQFAIDFLAYWDAGVRMHGGASPYAPRLLDGPIPAQTMGQYLYPPLLAQLLAPLTRVPFEAATIAWLVLQGAATVAAVWIAGTVGGLAATRERFLWSLAMSVLFLPAFDTLWKGNVSGFVALVVALVARGGAPSGFATVAATLVKVTPGVLALALPRAALRGVIVGIAVLVAAVALAPAAWLEYPVVLANLSAGSADFPTNVAPHVQLPAVIPPAGAAAGGVRALELATAVVLVAFAVFSRRGRSPDAAVVPLCGAMLLAPASIWLHYLVILLPLAGLAWRRASSMERAVTVLGGVLVSASVALLPLATIGGILMWTCALRATRRPHDRAAAHSDLATQAD